MPRWTRQVTSCRKNWFLPYILSYLYIRYNYILHSNTGVPTCTRRHRTVYTGTVSFLSTVYNSYWMTVQYTCTLYSFKEVQRTSIVGEPQPCFLPGLRIAEPGREPGTSHYIRICEYIVIYDSAHRMPAILLVACLVGSTSNCHTGVAYGYSVFRVIYEIVC